jgi:hypothetical protein
MPVIALPKDPVAEQKKEPAVSPYAPFSGPNGDGNQPSVQARPMELQRDPPAERSRKDPDNRLSHKHTGPRP